MENRVRDCKHLAILLGGPVLTLLYRAEYAEYTTVLVWTMIAAAISYVASFTGFGITAAGRRYLEPLIHGEDYPPYEKGMPKYVTLKLESVARKLGDFEL